MHFNTTKYKQLSALKKQFLLLVPLSHMKSFSESYFPKTIRDWNRLSNDVKQSVAEYL